MGKKETIVTELKKQLQEALNERYDFALDLDSYHHRITLYFRLFVENKESLVIEDSAGVLADDIIEFEDCIIFHQARDLSCDDALATFVFDRKQGMEKAQLYAVANTLNEVLEEGESDLLDFVTDPDKEEFELQFDEEKYQAYYEQGKEKYGATKVGYPKF